MQERHIGRGKTQIQRMFADGSVSIRPISVFPRSIRVKKANGVSNDAKDSFYPSLIIRRTNV